MSKPQACERVTERGRAREYVRVGDVRDFAGFKGAATAARVLCPTIDSEPDTDPRNTTRKRWQPHTLLPTRVKIPMMPKGVEHFVRHTFALYFASGEDSNDAERR